MADKTEIKAKRRPYKKPEIEQVRLVPEEAVLTGCKMSTQSGPGDITGCNPQGRPKCPTPQS
jgi:hypothetical protein